MRQLGTLPKQVDPAPFADYLTSLGFSSRVDEGPHGWLVWIYDENHLSQAKAEFASYLENPSDPRFHSARETAAARRRELQLKDDQYRKNVRDMRGAWDKPNLHRKPVTVFLMVVSIAVFLLMRSPTEGEWVLRHLLISSFPDEVEIQPSLVLNDITRHWELWRLVTPIFIHYGGMHILFNMTALWALGSLIETRLGSRTMIGLVLATAVASNVGQVAYDLSVSRASAFGGMSGVLYGLFGYLWLKGKLQPEQGIILNPSYVQMMLFWLVLCMTGVMGPIANGAHFVGLIMGALLSLARL
ncbi:rhomboid family intramembrane serine protease [Singulisphaera sp. PoT]|uniref:rhomboid family intramembrane serine protease n=1 Tax=Singulisphaera sp. PoT TaxID=3411797 RepID=UPI003BF5E2C4